MRYALISAIHANLPALRAVLDDIDKSEYIDAIYHLGDLTGYAPWPNETVDLQEHTGFNRLFPASFSSLRPLLRRRPEGNSRPRACVARCRTTHALPARRTAPDRSTRLRDLELPR